MKPPARRRLWCASGRVRGLPGGMVGAFLSKTTSCRETDRGRRRGPSRGPRPLRRLLRALRRPTGPVAEPRCVLGTFPLQPKRAQKRSPGGARCPLPDVGQGCSQAVAQARRALRHVCSREARPICRPRPRRPKSEYPFGTCALQTRRPRRDNTGEAHRALPRRHAPPERRRARRLAHGVAGHDVARLALAAAVAAAAGAQLR